MLFWVAALPRWVPSGEILIRHRIFEIVHEGINAMIAEYFKKPQGSPKPRLVPVIAIEDAAEALPLGRTLLENGLPIAEVRAELQSRGALLELPGHPA